MLATFRFISLPFGFPPLLRPSQFVLFSGPRQPAHRQHGRQLQPVWLDFAKRTDGYPRRS